MSRALERWNVYRWVLNASAAFVAADAALIVLVVIVCSLELIEFDCRNEATGNNMYSLSPFFFLFSWGR